MNIEPLLSTTPAIQFHVITALVSVVTGLLILLAPKGTVGHRWLGRLFVIALGATALSSFAIHEMQSIGSFSMIHLLSVVVLVSLIRAVRAIQCGEVRQHGQAMMGAYISLLIAGVFTFLPGRLMARVVSEGTFAIVCLLLTLTIVMAYVVVIRK